MWFRKKTPEQKAKYIAKRTEKARKMNESVIIYNNSYCMTTKGSLYTFSKIVYDEDGDSIRAVMYFGDTEDGYYSFFNAEALYFSNIFKNDRERWLKFKSDADKLGLVISRKCDNPYTEEETKSLVLKAIDKFCAIFSQELKMKCAEEFFEENKK